MQYRTLGRTGLKISQLGFGAMRLPMVGEGDDHRVDDEKAVPMIHRAFEAGVNYIDSAVMYCHHDSERAVGVALKGWRDKVIVSTKNHYHGEDEKQWWTNLENSLRKLDIDCIDIYNHHGINWKCYTENVKPRTSKWMQQAKDQGLIRHICCSFHAGNDDLEQLVNEGYPDAITLQYNLFDRRLEPGIALAHEKGIGIVVMGPVGGGRLGDTSDVLENLLPDVKRVPELALRFVLSNPHVTTAISGMSTLQQVEENIATAKDDVLLSDKDKQAIEEHLKRLQNMADLYCTGCGYCLPCPHDVAIPQVFDRYNRARVYGLWKSAREEYARLVRKGGGADQCVECGECEEKCPQDLPIMEQLKEAHNALTDDAR